MSRIVRLETFIQFTTFDQSDASIRSRFRRNSVSKIRDLNFSSQTSSYFSIINFDLDSEFDTSRQSIVESDITSSERRSVSIQVDNSQTSSFTQTEEIRRIMSSIQSSFEVDSILWNDIMIVIIAFASMSRSADETSFSVDNNNDLQSIIRFVENVDYFDSNYENSIDIDQSIVNFEKHNFYRDVYIFIDHLKNLNKITSDSKVKELVIICLKKEALRWYNSKLTEIEKNFFRKITIERWCIHLIKRFKKKSSVVLKKLQTEFYTYVDARRERRSRVYMQNILRYFRIADYSFVFHQCITVWNNLELDFRTQISEFAKDIILFSFLTQLNAKESVWMNMIVRQRDLSNSDVDFNNNVDRINRSSKQNRERQDDYQQQFDVNDSQFSYSYSEQYEKWLSFDYTSYQFKNSAYQNQKNQYQFFVEKSASAAIVLSFVKQSLQLIFESESNSKNQARTKFDFQTSEERFDNRVDKIRTYVVDEKNEFENEFHEKSNQEQENYHVDDENFTYYESDSQNDEKTVNFISSVLATTSKSRCRHCKNSFSFNNNLHRHLRVSCSTLVKISTKKTSSSHLNFFEKTKFETVYSVVFVSSIETIKNSFSSISSVSSLFEKTILRFNVSFAFDVDTDYDFRDWNYVKIKVFLSLIVESANVCLNIDVDVSLMNRTFFKTQTSNTFVRTMISSLQIRDLSTNRHQTWKYAVCDIYLSKSKNDKNVISLIQREVHLVNDLKANMLIDNDIIDSEQFIIDMKIKQTTIENIDVSISIEVKSAKTSLQRLIHLKKIVIISSHIEMIISVHNVNLSVSRDFLFESENSKLVMYVHLIDVSITAILIRNDKNIFVKISRNYRLDRVFELDFSNVFHIEDSDDVRHFAIKKSKTSHRDEWFKKLISVCVTTYVVVIAIKIEATLINFFSLVNVLISFITSEVFDVSVASLSDFTFDFADIFSSSKIVLFNDVTIYHFESNTVDFFVKIVNDFSTLWHDIDFASMSENKWMRISLKFDWETRVFDKIKIYSLKVKNRELVDKTFDELHRIDKLFWTNESTFFSYSIFCVWKTVEEERKDKVIVDIRDFNVITQSNVYSLSLQTNILTLIRDCKYIFVIDCFAFFYQWRVHSTNRHKLIVMSHRNQKSFNVTVMNYKNSSAYVQRQINRLFRTLREFARAYVDDIVIFSHIKKEHESHLRRVFIVLIENNIFIKIVKVFLDYSSISLLDQKVDSFDLTIFEKKLKTISKLRFSRILRQLEIYLNLIDWMRNYVSYYAYHESCLNVCIDWLARRRQ